MVLNRCRSDLYNGRLERAKEKWGKKIFTTRDYRELLAKSDIEAAHENVQRHRQLSCHGRRTG
jgi:hypothetical protein